MPILPEEWLGTAENLVLAEAPTEADLRRAVSTAYYALFHFLLKTATERFLGSTLTSAYAKLYRAYDHGRMRDLCEQLDQDKIGNDLAARVGFARPSADVRTFARNFKALRQGRHEADYNPLMTQSASDGLMLVQLGQDTMRVFTHIPQQDQNAILLYMPLGAR